MGNDYDDLYRPGSNPWPEKETRIQLLFNCKGCHAQVDKHYTQSVIDKTPGCKEYCLDCLLKKDSAEGKR